MEGFVVGWGVPLGESGGEGAMIVSVKRLRLAQNGYSVMQFVGDEVAGLDPDPLADLLRNGDLSLRGYATGHGKLLLAFAGRE
jgi:hypothetical protein